MSANRPPIVLNEAAAVSVDHTRLALPFGLRMIESPVSSIRNKASQISQGDLMDGSEKLVPRGVTNRPARKNQESALL